MNNMNQKIQELESLLHSREEGAKRNGAIENKQVEILNDYACELRTEFTSMGVQIDTKLLRNRRLKENQWVIKDNGKIINSKSSERDSWFDSKSFDAILPITIKGSDHTLYFIMKGVDEQGGHQGNVKQEIAQYLRQIENNVDENTYFIFLLDGEYFKKELERFSRPQMTEKYAITTSSNVKDIVKTYISEHLV